MTPPRSLRALAQRLLVALALLSTAHAAPPPASERASASEHSVGRHAFSFDYRGGGGTRHRTGILWYPSSEAGKAVGAIADAPAAPGRYPLIVFSHGFLGAANQSWYLTEALARHGYIVAAVNHADAAPARGGAAVTIPNFIDAASWDERSYVDRKEDLSALLDRLLADDSRAEPLLAGHVDAGAVGAMGHSLGGYTVLGLGGAWATWRDTRIGAVLALSPYLLPYLAKNTLGAVVPPVMLQGGTQDWALTPFLPQAYDVLSTPKAYLVLRDADHLAWTLTGGTNIGLIVRYSLAFFDRHLRGQPQDLLLRPNPQLADYQHDE